MPIWNRYDAEVLDERAWGSAGSPTRPTSYKAQALRELGRRLELEEHVSELQHTIMEMCDRLDVLEDAVQAAREGQV